jgi:hypothetical protein
VIAKKKVDLAKVQNAIADEIAKVKGLIHF